MLVAELEKLKMKDMPKAEALVDLPDDKDSPDMETVMELLPLTPENGSKTMP